MGFGNGGRGINRGGNEGASGLTPSPKYLPRCSGRLCKKRKETDMGYRWSCCYCKSLPAPCNAQAAAVIGPIVLAFVVAVV